MIADLKPYPAYKESGVPWLGEVPEHWEVRRLGALVRERGETNDDNTVTEVLSVMRERGVIPYAEKGNVGNKKSEDITRYKIVRPDDIVVNCMNVIIGSVGLSRYTGCLSPVYYVLTRRSKRDEPRYLNAYFQTKPFQLSLVRIGNGILAHRMRIPMELLKCEPFPRPPGPEQAAIVRFLDHADRRIRRYIRAKQKLIKLLEEQKQAIIHRAVTRGLDPNVRLKPSGVEWLGDVPRHWEVVRSGSVFRLFGGFAFPGTGFVRDESDEALPVLLTPVNFDPVGGLRFGSKSTVRFRGSMPVQFKLRKGALVTVLTDLSSKRLILGRAGFIEHDGVLLNQRTARVDIHTSIRSRLNAQYLCWVLNSRAVREQTISTSRGSTVFHTSPTRMLAGRWPLPPLEEQHEIVERLETLKRTQGAAYERLRYEIELLREYRTRLIADVVTGKLDVREAAARLPDEVDEPEALQDTDTLTEGDNDTDEADLDAVPAEA